MISVEKSIAFPDRRVSQLYFTLEAAMLPLYSYLLGICDGSYTKIRSRQGRLAGLQAHHALSSVPQGRV